MAEQILDGTNGSYRARVGSDNRLQTRSLSESEIIHACEVGNAYTWNTGLITISGNATLAYVKNNSDNNLIITDIAIGSFEGITHSNAPYLTLIKNPTGGDLISDASAVSMNENRNFGSAKTADAYVYKGKTSGTITGGSDVGILEINKTSRSLFTINFLLPKGASLAVKLTTNLSSGSASYYCALIGYFKDDLDSE